MVFAMAGIGAKISVKTVDIKAYFIFLPYSEGHTNTMRYEKATISFWIYLSQTRWGLYLRADNEMRTAKCRTISNVFGSDSSRLCESFQYQGDSPVLPILIVSEVSRGFPFGHPTLCGRPSNLLFGV